MNRRCTISFVLALVAAVPIGAQAQATGKVYRLGVIVPSDTAAEAADRQNPGRIRVLRALQERGYVEGQNLVYDRRTAEGVMDRIPDIVADLVRLRTDVIVVPHVGIAKIATTVTTTVPIVSLAGDPVMRGLAQSLNRPGGNVTGIMAAGTSTVEQKRLELLRALVPSARRIAFVASRAWWDEWMGKAMHEAATALGIQVVYVEGKSTSFAEAFAVVRREKPDAVFFEASPTAFAFRSAIGEFALTSRIPSACGHQELVESGCLMTYNFVTAETYRALADFFDRIVKGAKAGDLPVHQYSRYEFAVNAKTAQAIGLAIPQSVLARADRVIE